MRKYFDPAAPARKSILQNDTFTPHPGTNLPYVVHLSNVAMEIIIASFNSDNFSLGLAVQVALLHDTIILSFIFLHPFHPGGSQHYQIFR